MNKYRYNINNLDCANCAREIEEALNERSDFKNASVNFSTCKVSYESEKEFTLEELNKIIKEVEPDAYLTENKVDNVKKEFHLSIFLIAIIISAFTYFFDLSKNTKLVLYIISYALLLYRPVINAIKLLLKKNGINENALISISCIGAFLLGEVMEGIMVISLYTIGKLLEEKAINKSRKSINDLLNIKEPYANLKTGKTFKKIPVEEVKINDILIVKKGEKIPVDGIVVKGSSLLDMTALTGESNLVQKNINDEVLSGSINSKDIIEIKATSEFKDSTVSKIIELLETATDKKSKTETTVTKISKIYTPLIIGLALLIAVFLPVVSNTSLTTSIYRSLTFLVISCPCAIAISIPLSYFTAIGVASKKGILIKGSNYLDNLSNITSIIFDKTGTLTNGSFNVSSIEITDDNLKDKYTMDEIINILIKGESYSNHPIANSIIKLKDIEVDNSDVKDFKEITGGGISFTLDKKHITIGSSKMCACQNDAMIHLNINGKHVASITIDDGIKANTKNVIKYLKDNNIRTYMFTGDKKDIALDIGKKLEIDEIKYEMLPQDKFKYYENISKLNDITVFVGDGINDAPVLKRADIGISMGEVGSDVAIEASDIVIMGDDLAKITVAINISKYTKKIIKQNLIFAMTVKILIILLSIFGFANMWMAVFADTGVTLLTIINTLRIMKKFR